MEDAIILTLLLISEICHPADLNCQQGCGLDNTGNVTCTCNPGYSLANDGTSCQSQYNYLLL